MANSIINDFSVLSPSQKKELERKRKENEERKAAEAARKAVEEEASKRAEEDRIAAIRAANAALEAKKQNQRTLWSLLIVAIIIAMLAVIHYWFHFTTVIFAPRDIFEYMLFLMLLGIIALPVVGVLVAAIVGCTNKIKNIK